VERSTLDQEGARRGEISAASLQLQDDTIAIRRIATMSIESHEFKPWDGPRNRQAQKLWATFSVALVFFGLLGLAGWALMPGQETGVIALGLGLILMLIGLALGTRAIWMAMRMARKVPYHRLLIGTSDGRQIRLVDDNREVLTKIRDAVRYKLDTGDAELTGDFDLNLDIVNVRLPKARPLEASRGAAGSDPAAGGSGLIPS
jgi:hypothetical protein